MTIQTHTQLVKQLAYAQGFNYVGIAKAELLVDDAKRLENWLNKNHHGNMHYMENYFDLRIDPTKLVPDAKSVITLLLNYFPEQQQQAHAPKIASYAYGTDYHYVIKEKLNNLLQQLQAQIGAIHGRGFVDSAPVLERAWAVKSGLGWVGKNGNLITKQQGSFFFIATLITDLALEYDAPMAKDYCGTCTACIDACPTNAILPNKEINGSQCISYYTIELKDAVINTNHNFDNWIFGCDVCQDVCPWNRFSQPHSTKAFTAIPQILNLSTSDWLQLTKENFNTIFKNSPLKRSKHEGIIRNLNFISTTNTL